MDKFDIQTEIFTPFPQNTKNEQEMTKNSYKQMFLNGEITKEQYNLLNCASIYTSDKYKKTNNEDGELNTEPDETKVAYRFKELLTNPNILNDEILLEELKNIKQIDLHTLLQEYRDISGHSGLLIDIKESTQIKESTKKKFEDVFTQILEDEYFFDKNYESNFNQVYFETKEFTYESEEYKIKQKDKNSLEIENKNTKEKKIVNFNKLVPNDIQDINDVISLKAAIQKLPGEVLFQIPDEVSFIINTDLLKAIHIIEDSEDKTTHGVVEMLGKDKNMQLFVSDGYEKSVVHELSHAIFTDKNGNDALLKNEKVMNSYKTAMEKLKEENISFPKDGDYYYWSNNIKDFGAEILTAIMLNNYQQIEIIEKYAPNISQTIIDIYNDCKSQPKENKHTPANFDRVMDSLNRN